MLRLYHLTDTHLFGNPGQQLGGVDVDASLAGVLERMRRDRWPPFGVLATGDFVQEETPRAYSRLMNALWALDVPVYCLPGNHEDKGLLRDACSGNVRWRRHVRAGSWQVIMLDSGVPGAARGRLGDDELAFLDAQLCAIPHAPTLLAIHHQPVPVGSWLDDMMLENADDFFAVVDRHPQVRGVVFGHVHQEFETWRNEVRIISSPSTCVQFLPGSPESAYDDRGPGYRWLDLYPDGRIETQVVRI